MSAALLATKRARKGKGQMAQYQVQAGISQPGSAASGPDFEPVAGVTLRQFAAVSKGIAAYNYDRSRLAEVAASQGIDPVSWEAASQCWTGRIQANPAVAHQFNRIYRAGA